MGFGDDDQNRASGIQDDAEYGHQHHAHGARAASGRRVEIIIGGDRRRKWSPELKAQITEEPSWRERWAAALLAALRTRKRPG